jgi:hypothetical protein
VAAAVAPACRSSSPSLTLTFSGLPATASTVTVTLSSGAASFGGGAGSATPAAAVSYPGDGTVVITIDRAVAAARGDHLRFPLTASSALELDATARATDGGVEYAASAHAEVRAGADTVLAFDFRAPGQGADAGGSDGMTVAPPDAGRDVPGQDSSSTGDGADRPPDGSSDTGIPARCVVSAPRPASAATASGAPAIGFASSLFGVAWTAGSGTSVVYNAVDASGTLLSAADVTVAPPASGVTMSAPHLAPFGANLALAYGHRAANGTSAPFLLSIAPATGAVLGAPALGSGAAEPAAREIGDVAVNLAATRVAVASRGASAAMSTPATIDVFVANGEAASFGISNRAGNLAATWSTGLGWSAGNFVVGAVVDMSANGGAVATFADGDLASGVQFDFTDRTDQPVVGIAGASVSVAGIGTTGQVAVAWVDGQSCAGCSGLEVFLALWRTNGSAAVAQVQVSAPSQIQKRFPHVVFDGSAIAVAWLEYESTTRAAVKLRRYDLSLRPVGDTLDVGPAGAPQPVLADIGLCAAAPGEYGVVMSLFAAKQSFTHVICTGN